MGRSGRHPGMGGLVRRALLEWTGPAVRSAATLEAMYSLSTHPALAGHASLIVTEADTAIALGTGDVPVLSTSRLIALIEAAAVAALDGALPDDLTSVGVSLSIDHIAPSGIGATVRAGAVLEAIDDVALEFVIEAHDGETLVAVGGHTRVIVERDRLLARVSSTK